MPEEEKKLAACRRLAKFRQYLAAFVAGLMGLCVGSVTGWVSPMQPLLTSEHPPVGSTPMSMDTIAWLGSLNFIGSTIGTFIWGAAADRLGRKTATSLVAIPYILSWFMILIATNTGMLLVARFITGLGNSGTTISVPVFVSEIAQDDLRGFFGSFLVILFNTGILLSYIIGTYFGYNVLAICCLIIPVVFELTFFWFPETPMFLWKNGQTQKAEQSLLWYRGGDIVETEKVLMSYKSLQNKKSKQPSLKSLIATKGTIKALIISIALMTAMPCSGIFTILNFPVKIFEMCGTAITPYQAAIVLGSLQLLSSCFSSVLVDRLGRKVLLLGSLLTIAGSLTILGSYLQFLPDQPTNSALSWLPLVALSLHVISFAIGLGTVPFVIISEIFPPEIRGLAMSKINLVGCVFAFAIVKFFPNMNKLLKLQGCFWFYGSCSLFFAVFFYLYLPETKGKPQDIILKLLNKDILNFDAKTDEIEQLNLRQRPTIVNGQHT